MRILLLVYDNASYIHTFPIGLGYIADSLVNNGYEVTIYNQDQYHYPEKHLTEYLDHNRFDVIGVSFIAGYYQYRKMLKISKAINSSKQRPVFIIGGHGPSPDPEFFLRKLQADIVVIGEGEITILNILKELSNNRNLDRVKGIAYKVNNSITINDRQPLIDNIDSIPWPAYDYFPIEYYRLLRMPHVENEDFVISMISGRGCNFNCSFCYRLDKGFRQRSNEGIIEEIKFLKTNYGITYIAFHDELLMSSRERTESLCLDFIRSNINVKWCANGRLNYARQDILKLMREAGCVFINYGIESMDDEVLKNMNKALTTKQIIKGIEATINAGISPGCNIIFGNIGDSVVSLERGVNFLLKYDDGAQLRTIRPVTPYPGCPLYDYAIQKGLIVDCEDFYENKHVNSDLLTVNFTNMEDDQVYQCLLDANTRLVSNYYTNKLSDTVQEIKSLYLNKNTSFRGFRQT